MLCVMHDRLAYGIRPLRNHLLVVAIDTLHYVKQQVDIFRSSIRSIAVDDVDMQSRGARTVYHSNTSEHSGISTTLGISSYTHLGQMRLHTSTPVVPHEISKLLWPLSTSTS